MNEQKEIHELILHKHASWSRIQSRLLTMYYIVGVAGVAAASLAAALGGEYARFLASGSAVCTAILGFVQPEKRYQRFIAAWRVLDVAMMKFRLGKADLDDLVRAVEHGEALIGESGDKKT